MTPGRPWEPKKGTTIHAEPGPLGNLLLEIGEKDFRRSSWRRGKARTKWLAVSAVLGIPFLAVLSTFVDGYSPGLLAVASVVVVAAGLLAYLKSLELKRINRFGLWEKAIAPTRKPGAHDAPGRLIIPFEQIKVVTFQQVGQGAFPDSHFSVSLECLDGTQLKFDATEIFA